MSPPEPRTLNPEPLPPPPRRGPPELFQIVVECTGEAEQRTLFERLRAEGLKLRLLVL
jgi:hypothetical protein